MLYLMVPFGGDTALLAVVPLGTDTPATPGNTGLLDIAIVGFPADALPLATDIWLVVPTMPTGARVVLAFMATKPVPIICDKARGKPAKATTGLPD